MKTDINTLMNLVISIVEKKKEIDVTDRKEIDGLVVANLQFEDDVTVEIAINNNPYIRSNMITMSYIQYGRVIFSTNTPWEGEKELEEWLVRITR